LFSTTHYRVSPHPSIVSVRLSPSSLSEKVNSSSLRSHPSDDDAHREPARLERVAVRRLHATDPEVVMQAPMMVVNQNATRETGSIARANNIAAAKAVSDVVRTTLGPRSMLKMILDASGGE